MSKPIIPIFYACDDAFVKYTVVSLSSMIENASSEYHYKIHVLHTDISNDMKDKLLSLQNSSFEIVFTNVSDELDKIGSELPVRHYYSKTTYYRFFIAEMFPEYDKAIYIDGDTVVLGDISKLYETDIGSFYLGACREQAMEQVDVYGAYAEKVVGVSRHCFFNAGIMLINTKQFREKSILKRFISLLKDYEFIVTQDEDYLNVICKDQVYLLEQKWNTELTEGLSYTYDYNDAYILHYIMVNKPWHYREVRGADIFWSYAKKTSIFDALKAELDSYTDEQRERDKKSADNLCQLAIQETNREDNYLARVNQKRSAYRVDLVEKISRYEREERFDEDVESDPPSRMLMPDEIDYLRRSLRAKIKTNITHIKAKIFQKTILKKGIMVIKEIKGTENFKSLKSGAVITCNHFNAFDSFAIQEAYHASAQWPKRKFYRVIREGNYTSFPGFFGELMRHFYTLPLSSNTKTMVKFTEATNKLLHDGNFVLFYPEQAMWWNYRKPRPLKPGAFKFAAKNGVPVLPCFITMRDTGVLGEELRASITDFNIDENFVPDGFYIQEYTIHIGEPIYPKSDLNYKENMEYMAKRNFEVWKEIYEKEYQTPLIYG